jgi:hypothetical protein
MGLNEQGIRFISISKWYIASNYIGENKFVAPPKVLRCTWFVRDHRPLVGKLDPHAIKCIFVGYSLGQKGYKCWSPSEGCLFVSMDVTLRESVPFNGEKTDLNFFVQV